MLPRADRDLDQAADYLTEVAGLEVGPRFLAAAHETFSLLATQPNMGWRRRLHHPALAATRVFRIRGFERVLVFYRPHRSGIHIIRMLHGVQDLEALLAKEEETPSEEGAPCSPVSHNVSRERLHA